jgi:L,D-transpeptidase catalytic domain/Sporulation and spore germination/Putative peptidoglycan binding domain
MPKALLIPRPWGDASVARSAQPTVRGLTSLLVLALAVVAVATAAAAPTRNSVPVFFLQGEQLVQVTRDGATPADALHHLLSGPTHAEITRGLRTYVPSGTKVRRLTVAGGIATVDLGARFASGRNAQSLLARLSQLVRTLTGLHGAVKVKLLIDGRTVRGVFPGVPTQSPITFRYLQTPNVQVPTQPRTRLPPVDDHVKQVQQRLIALGFLGGDADGRLGPATQNAILGFQKWERLQRTGSLDARTESRLTAATHPAPVSQGHRGKRAEILLDRQVALLIKDNRVVRTIAVSTGKPSTPTPPGNYRVYAKITRWWSTPFREWLPWALPFVGGIAFHEFLDVPSYPASHGCVRQAVAVARWTYNFAEVGMPVIVIAKSWP